MQASLPDEAQSYLRRQAVDELRVGAAEADITPADLPYLGGFGINRPATAVHAPLKARAMVLHAGDVRLAIVGIDNLGLQRQDADWIKGGIVGYRFGDVFLCSSHTHAAPDLIGMWGYYFLTSGRDAAYVQRVRQGVAAAVAAASASAQPARLSIGDARLPAAGLVKNANRSRVFDRRLVTIHAVDAASGAAIGSLLHMACHPEVLSRHQTLVSPDFVGPLCDAWRAKGFGQAVFVNGALGAMVSPQVEDRGPDGVANMGARLAALFQTALASAEPMPVDSIEVRRRDVYLPMESLGLMFGRQTGVIPRPTHAGLIRSTVGYLRLGAFEAICVPGEMEPTLAARIRRLSGRPQLVVFGLVDDEVGYLLSRRDADDPEFEYERGMSPGPDAGELVVRALLGQ